MTTTAFDRLTAKAQRLERELREARARERRIRALANRYRATAENLTDAALHDYLRLIADGLDAALDQDGDDDA